MNIISHFNHGIPKRKYFDPFVCSEICNESASSSYSKAGRIIASKIGNRINNNLKPKQEATTYTSRYNKGKDDYEYYDTSQKFNFLYQEHTINFIKKRKSNLL